MDVARRIEREGMAAFHDAVPPALAAARGVEPAEIAGAACSVVRTRFEE